MERFYKKINKTDKCWEWTACLNDKGYGQFRLDGRMRAAHRVMWVLVNGPIPNKLFVCHHCDNTKCVNPSHLFLGNQLDNMRDMYKKKRNPKRSAEDNGNHKLSWQDVYLIRSIYPALSTYKLGKQFGVTNTLIHQIVKNKIWKEKKPV